jgi:hypothetical protein
MGGGRSYFYNGAAIALHVRAGKVTLKKFVCRAARAIVRFTLFSCIIPLLFQPLLIKFGRPRGLERFKGEFRWQEESS